MAHTYALIAEVTVPAPRLEQSSSELQVEQQGPTARPEDGLASETEAEPDPNSAVPSLLVRAHQVVVAAGGTMYSSDLAETLGVGAQQLGTELTKILRTAGVTRPKNGAVSPARGMPARSGFTAETLATAIATYRIRAELAGM
ncbi:hypothetical protein HLK59_11620 [Streptomyces sp. S3(2020)]|uniref:hypothetical protein n=1 Tax=Streptomyces sp. S3(2020) TaxID=2732044 RepID=UPI0014889F67|nr:hypothetical protein [Streptomyces sp. S3(2020)]NNN31008.1 hypothetical protein [Streptomyces sp. S3(2020)]